MKNVHNTRTLGFALIEALIALLLISIGLIAVSKLQSATLFGSGDGRARAEAANLSQQKLEELRNLLQKGDFTLLGDGKSKSTKIKGSNDVNEYTLTWTVTPDPDAALAQHLVTLATTWTDSRGNTQRLDLNTRVAWDDPGVQAGIAVSTSGTLISPTGAAQRGSGKTPAGTTPVSTHQQGVEIRREADGAGKTYLIKDGEIVLFLPPNKDGPQDFVLISGRVIFDTSGLGYFKKGGADPDTSDKVFVRLSSEGECVYDNENLETHPTSSAHKYFDYTCYVGPGWYGNVGISTIGDTGSDPKICVGDPNFNGGKLASFTTSPHPDLSATRTYRGFHPDGGVLVSVGMKSGGRYGTALDEDGVALSDGPFDGAPTPFQLATYYATAPAELDPSNYLKQDFLVTGNADCVEAMKPATETIFEYNAGVNVCISPNQLAKPGECPTPSWPGAGYADTPGPGAGTSCNIHIKGGVDGKPDVVRYAYSAAPDDELDCDVGTIKGIGSYICKIKGMPADKLTTTILLKKYKGKPLTLIGTPTPVTMPSECLATTAVITKSI